MTRTDHRLGYNFKKNHPNIGQDPSQIDRKAWRKNKKIIGKISGIVAASMICDGKFLNEKTGCSVIFDDDGRVAYAYLLAPDEHIVADVWLYNRCETPLQPEWPDQEKMPFATPASYAKDHRGFLGVSNISDVSVEWGCPLPH